MCPVVRHGVRPCRSFSSFIIASPASRVLIDEDKHRTPLGYYSEKLQQRTVKFSITICTVRQLCPQQSQSLTSVTLVTARSRPAAARLCMPEKSNSLSDEIQQTPTRWMSHSAVCAVSLSISGRDGRRYCLTKPFPATNRCYHENPVEISRAKAPMNSSRADCFTCDESQTSATVLTHCDDPVHS
jgi:hypothetical protein